MAEVGHDLDRILAMLPDDGTAAVGAGPPHRNRSGLTFLPRRTPGAAVGGALMAVLGVGVGLVVGGAWPQPPALRPLPAVAMAAAPDLSRDLGGAPIAGPAATRPLPAPSAQATARGTAHGARGAVRQPRGAHSSLDCAASHCSYLVAIEADHRLRNAYARALRSGADREQLAAVNDRWWRLRMAEGGHPSRLAAGYGRLARDLQTVRRHPAHRARRPSFFHWIETRWDW